MKRVIRNINRENNWRHLEQSETESKFVLNILADCCTMLCDHYGALESFDLILKDLYDIYNDIHYVVDTKYDRISIRYISHGIKYLVDFYPLSYFKFEGELKTKEFGYEYFSNLDNFRMVYGSKDYTNLSKSSIIKCGHFVRYEINK